MTKRVATHSKGLVLIGIYKLFEAALLVAAGIGILHLLHRDVSAWLLHLVHALRADPRNHYIHSLLTRAVGVGPKQLEALSVGTFCYAALRLAEGLGLVLRKTWGEYLTAIATGLFLPLEIYEMFRHFTAFKAGVFAVNVAIVWYLVRAIRR